MTPQVSGITSWSLRDILGCPVLPTQSRLLPLWIKFLIIPGYPVLSTQSRLALEMTHTHSPDNVLQRNRGGGCGLGTGGWSEHTSFHLSWFGLLAHLRIPVKVLWVLWVWVKSPIVQSERVEGVCVCVRVCVCVCVYACVMCVCVYVCICRDHKQIQSSPKIVGIRWTFDWVYLV